MRSRQKGIKDIYRFNLWKLFSHELRPTLQNASIAVMFKSKWSFALSGIFPLWGIYRLPCCLPIPRSKSLKTRPWKALFKWASTKNPVFPLRMSIQNHLPLIFRSHFFEKKTCFSQNFGNGTRTIFSSSDKQNQTVISKSKKIHELCGLNEISQKYLLYKAGRILLSMLISSFSPFLI